MSGQKVNYQKSNIHLSASVDRTVAAEIVKENLCHYHRVQSIHGRMGIGMFHNILDKIKAKPESWKTKYLVLAEGQTLGQAVLCAIPYYQMQTKQLPSGVCKSIDRMICNFLRRIRMTRERCTWLNGKWSQQTRIMDALVSDERVR